jgi:uncharacterized protein
MGKILLIALIAFAAYLLFKKYKKNLEGDAKPPKAVEDMVRCAQCGVHLPKQESIESEGRFYCSDEHRRLHAQR